VVAGSYGQAIRRGLQLLAPHMVAETIHADADEAAVADGVACLLKPRC